MSYIKMITKSYDKKYFEDQNLPKKFKGAKNGIRYIY